MNTAADMQLIDHLADGWRWWTSMGALLAGAFLAPRAGSLIAAIWRGDPETDTILPKIERLTTTVFALLLMAGFVVAGAIIPVATDGRVPWLNEGSTFYHHAMAYVWFTWGCGAWGIAISLADGKKHMAGASLVWGIAVFFAARESIGQAL